MRFNAARALCPRRLRRRQPGAREARWTHLIGGPVEAGAPPQTLVDQRSDGASRAGSAADDDAMARLNARIDALERRVGDLDDLVSRLSRASGLAL